LSINTRLENEAAMLHRGQRGNQLDNQSMISLWRYRLDKLS